MALYKTLGLHRAPHTLPQDLSCNGLLTLHEQDVKRTMDTRTTSLSLPWHLSIVSASRLLQPLCFASLCMRAT